MGLPPGTRIDPTSGRVFQPIARPNGQYPQEGVHYPQNGGHHPSENGGHHLAPKQVFEDPRHAEIGQELLQYNDLMSQSEAPSDNEEGHPMLPRITPGINMYMSPSHPPSPPPSSPIEVLNIKISVNDHTIKHTLPLASFSGSKQHVLHMISGFAAKFEQILLNTNKNMLFINQRIKGGEFNPNK